MAPPSAKCRICSCNCKIQFGTTAGKDQHRSSENLFLPSKRKAGLQVPNDPSRYSSRVCNKWAHIIRSLGTYTVKDKSSLELQNNNLSTPNKENVAPIKRLLNSSPCRKAVRIYSPASRQYNIILAITANISEYNEE